MFDLLWLILPIAAATGWWAGYRYAGNRQSSSEKRLRRVDSEKSLEYYRGLSYLLNDKQDKAIEVFLRMAEIDGDLAETHLALGSLFRRQGEVNRAIRIHQSMVARSELPPALHEESVIELARDYRAAGLLDRAEQLYRSLLASAHHGGEAFNSLLALLEREREWQQAIELAAERERVAGKSEAERIAQYYCELAHDALSEGRRDQSIGFLNQSLQVKSQSPRALIMLGDLFVESQDYVQAIASYQCVCAHEPELEPEVSERLLNALTKAEDESALLDHLDHIRGRMNGFSVIVSAMEVIKEREGELAAESFFKDQLLKRPSLKGLGVWAKMELAKRPSDDREKIQVIVNLLEQIAEMNPTHICTRCGFHGRVLHWQCPSCQSWNSVRPVIGAEGE